MAGDEAGLSPERGLTCAADSGGARAHSAQGGRAGTRAPEPLHRADLGQVRAVTTEPEQAGGHAGASPPRRPRAGGSGPARPADIIDISSTWSSSISSSATSPGDQRRPHPLACDRGPAQDRSGSCDPLKNKVISGFRSATTRRAKAAAALCLWAIFAESKLVVLQLVDLAFREAVSPGGFLPVTFACCCPTRVTGRRTNASLMTSRRDSMRCPAQPRSATLRGSSGRDHRWCRPVGWGVRAVIRGGPWRWGRVGS